MNEKELEHFVDGLQRQAKHCPRDYQAKVAMLAALGYVYILGVVALLSASIIALFLLAGKAHLGYFAFKLSIPCVALIWILGRSLYIKFPPPDGIPINKATAPELFSTIAEISRLTHGPPIHQVLINNEFNCCISQQPRLGIFGWHQNRLLLGLPFMQSMSAAEFRAVLAHEMGHLCSNHGKFSSWVYGVRNAWARIAVEVKQEGWIARLLLLHFCNWYTEKLDAYSFVLMREHELEADQLSARAAGVPTAAQALINTAIRGSYLTERFWPRVFDNARHYLEPPADIYAQLGQEMRQNLGRDDSLSWLHLSLISNGTTQDTHPPLRQRLQALGINLKDAATAAELLPPALTDDAATALLQDSLPQLQALAAGAWRRDVAQSWQDRHEYFASGQTEMERLHELLRQGAGLSDQDQLSLARWTSELGEKQQALALYQELLEQDANNADLHNEYGHLLLDSSNDAGIAHLDKAMELNPLFGLNNCQRLCAYFNKQTRNQEAELYQHRSRQFLEIMQKAMLERDGVSSKDEFEPHGLGQQALEKICQQLNSYQSISDAYLVRKKVQHLQTEPYLIVTVKIISRWYRLEASNKEKRTLDQLAAEIALPNAGMIISNTVIPNNLKTANEHIACAHIVAAQSKK